MKNLLRLSALCFCLLASTSGYAQIAQNMSLIGTWDNDDLPIVSGLAYNDIWGWVGPGGEEYAIVGSLEYTYFIDITDPANPVVRDSVQGTYNGCIHRDMKTYQQFCYSVADEGNSTLQIIDMSFLPDSVHLVYNSDQHFKRCHNLFIDTTTAKMYAVGTNTQGSGVIIFDLAANPQNPPVLANLNLGSYTHDLFARNDTAYFNNGPGGLKVYDFSTPTAPVTLAQLTAYGQQGYNHSCWLSDDGNHLVMADETHNTSMKLVDVSDFNNFQVTDYFRSKLLFPDSASIPHNPLVIGNYAVISYYHDGVQLFDFTDPNNVVQTAWYDTEPNNTNYNGFKGCWGVYPYLPSGNIIASDVLHGLFVLRPTFAFPFAMASDISGQDPTCPGQANGAALVTASGGTAPYHYLWSNGDTVANPQNLGTGTFTVTITDRYGHSTIDTIVLNGPPAWAIGDTITNESCAGTADGSIDISVSGATPGYSFLWSTGDATEDVSALGPGTYTVTITDAEGCTSNASFTVQTTFQSPVAEAGADTTLCSLQPLALAATPPTLGTGQWVVASGNASIANPGQPSASASGFSPGLNELVWWVTAGPCSDADTLEVYLSAAALVDAGPDILLCSGSTVLAGSDPGNGNGNWSAMPASVSFSATGDPMATASNFQPGTYQLVWSVNEAGCQAADTMLVTASLPPVAGFGHAVNLLQVAFFDQSTQATSWAWDFGDGNTSTLANPVHTYAQLGLYQVCLVATGDCGADTSCQSVSTVVVGQPSAPPTALEVFPNPGTGLLHLRMQQWNGRAGELELYDLQGKRLAGRSLEVTAGDLDMVWDLRGLPEGSYLLRLNSEGQQYHRLVRIVH